MAQLLVTFLVTALVWFSGQMASADDARPASPPAPAVKSTQKITEARYLDGLNCLESKDVGCANVALASLNPASPYAKLLRAQIIATSGAYDTPLRLLIPLQAETGLLPQASASLHATLALAYEAQDNFLYALEQRVQVEAFYDKPEQVADNQMRIWKMLSAQTRDVLVEMRGESSDTVVQGWIDLAIAVQDSDRKERSIAQWRAAYPDHPAGDALLASITRNGQVAKDDAPAVTGFQGKIALLLPLESPDYAAAARSVRAGVMAAFRAEAGKGDIPAYDTGGPEGVFQAYQRAVADGAQFVIGPLTRDEVTALSAQTLTVPVLALNQPEGNVKAREHLMLFGLPAEAEAREVAQLARDHGMQSALIVASNDPLGQRMAKAFAEEWRGLDGSITAQLTIPAVNQLADFKAEAAAHPADMIFLAAGADQARLARPYLDLATPTYGTSHIYDGMPRSVQNVDLVAVHFVDLPWLVDPENPVLALFRSEEQAPSAELRRMFAMGVDAYRLIPLLAANPVSGKKLLEGATGSLSLGEGGTLMRELPVAQFRREGVVLESTP